MGGGYDATSTYSPIYPYLPLTYFPNLPPGLLNSDILTTETDFKHKWPKAGGMHPTGMYSCFNLVLPCSLQLNNTLTVEFTIQLRYINHVKWNYGDRTVLNYSLVPNFPPPPQIIE